MTGDAKPLASSKPEFPLERRTAVEYAWANDFSVQRCDGTGVPNDRPDTIILSVRGRGGFGNFDTYLSPAVLVHIANTMLTDGERAAIAVPASPAATFAPMPDAPGPQFTSADLSLLSDIADGFSTVLHYDRLDDLRMRMRASVERSAPATV